MAYTEKVLMDLSQDRLEGLLNERLNARGNKDEQDHIDQRIWDLFGEEWCILFTDLSGFSKHAKEFGIIQLIQTIKESERIFSPVIENYDGFVVKTEGDTLIVIFRSRKKAIKCAIDLQNLSKNYNEGKASEDHIILCCGLGWGKILRVPGLKVDIFGEEVNFSAKLGEDTANGGEILITNNLAENFPEMEGVELIEHGYLSNGGMPIFKAIY